MQMRSGTLRARYSTQAKERLEWGTQLEMPRTHAAYVRAEARTLQEPSLSASYEAMPYDQRAFPRGLKAREYFEQFTYGANARSGEEARTIRGPRCSRRG